MLDMSQFEQDYNRFSLYLAKNKPYTWEVVRDLKPLEVNFVNVQFGNPRLELKYTNGLSIKIPDYLYRSCPTKREIFKTI